MAVASSAVDEVQLAAEKRWQINAIAISLRELLPSVTSGSSRHAAPRPLAGRSRAHPAPPSTHSDPHRPHRSRHGEPQNGRRRGAGARAQDLRAQLRRVYRLVGRQEVLLVDRRQLRGDRHAALAVGREAAVGVARRRPSSTERCARRSSRAELAVLDCLGQMDVAEAILASIGGAQWEDEKVLVGVSSVMTWTRTTPDADEPEKPLTEAEYKRRRPHSSFKELHALESSSRSRSARGCAPTSSAPASPTAPRRTSSTASSRRRGTARRCPSSRSPTARTCRRPCTSPTCARSSDEAPRGRLRAVHPRRRRGQQQEEAGTLKAIVTALSASLGTGAVEGEKEAVLLERDYYEFFQALDQKLAPEAANGLPPTLTGHPPLFAPRRRSRKRVSSPISPT